MWPLARRLGGLGYEVTNLGYFGPRGLQSSVETVFAALEERGLQGAPLDLVTHSMGGIVARALAAEGRIQIRRLVQLAPPNQGAWIADRVRRIPLFGRVPAFRDLGQGEEALVEGLGHTPPEVEVGVIAGQSASAWLGGEPGDGVVRVKETHLPSAQDWILLPHFHTVIMNGRDTMAEVDHFLQRGRFSSDAERLGLDDEGRLLREQPQPEPEQVTT